jgi:hypothetical protein
MVNIIFAIKYLAATSKTSSVLKIIYSTSVEFTIDTIFEINRRKCLYFFKISETYNQAENMKLRLSKSLVFIFIINKD